MKLLEEIDSQLAGKDLKRVKPQVIKQINIWKWRIISYLLVFIICAVFIAYGILSKDTRYAGMVGIGVIGIISLCFSWVAFIGFQFQRKKLQVIEEKLNKKS